MRLSVLVLLMLAHGLVDAFASMIQPLWPDLQRGLVARGRFGPVGLRDLEPRDVGQPAPLRLLGRSLPEAMVDLGGPRRRGGLPERHRAGPLARDAQRAAGRRRPGDRGVPPGSGGDGGGERAGRPEPGDVALRGRRLPRPGGRADLQRRGHDPLRPARAGVEHDLGPGSPRGPRDRPGAPARGARPRPGGPSVVVARDRSADAGSGWPWCCRSACSGSCRRWASRSPWPSR